MKKNKLKLISELLFDRNLYRIVFAILTIVQIGYWMISYKINNSLLFWPMLILSVFVFVKDMINREYLHWKTKDWIAIGLFVSMIISMIFNLEYCTTFGISTIARYYVYYYIYFINDSSCTKEKNIKTLKVILIIIVIFFAFYSTIASYCYITGNSVTFISGAVVVQNSDVRLNNIYVNPANAAILCFSALVSSLVLLTIVDNKLIKLINIYNLFIQSLTIAFTDTRSVQLAIVIIVLIMIARYIYINHYNKTISFIKISIVVVLSIGYLSSLFMLSGTRNYVDNIKNDIESIEVEDDFFKLNEVESIINTISSKRYEIWKETIYLSKNNLLFGNGIDSLLLKAEDTSDKLIISKKDYDNAHNLFVNTLYSGGLFALGLLITLMIIEINDFIKFNQDTKLFWTIVLSLIGLFVVCNLDRGIMYFKGIQSLLFWYFLGIFNMLCTKKEN